MRKSISTRERILQSGADLLSRGGFSGVSLSVLAEETGLSKSGLFAHFDSKEDVEMALLERTGALQQRVLGAAMKARKGLPRLKALVASWLGWPAKAGPGGRVRDGGGHVRIR